MERVVRGKPAQSSSFTFKIKFNLKNFIDKIDITRSLVIRKFVAFAARFIDVQVDVA